MNSKLYLAILLIAIMVTSCSSSKIVKEWRRPNSSNITFSKVLVIGMSENIEARTFFENDLVSRLKEEGVLAEKSIDAFSENYSSLPKNEAQLQELKGELVREDYDAVLVTRVFKQEESKTTARTLRDLSTLWGSLNPNKLNEGDEGDESDNQGIYERYHVYSSLYCSCGDDDEWKSIWRAYIEIKEPKKKQALIIKNGVKKYNHTFVKALKKQNLF